MSKLKKAGFTMGVLFTLFIMFSAIVGMGQDSREERLRTIVETESGTRDDVHIDVQGTRLDIDGIKSASINVLYDELLRNNERVCGADYIL